MESGSHPGPCWFLGYGRSKPGPSESSPRCFVIGSYHSRLLREVPRGSPFVDEVNVHDLYLFFYEMVDFVFGSVCRRTLWGRVELSPQFLDNDFIKYKVPGFLVSHSGIHNDQPPTSTPFLWPVFTLRPRRVSEKEVYIVYRERYNVLFRGIFGSRKGWKTGNQKSYWRFIRPLCCRTLFHIDRSCRTQDKYRGDFIPKDVLKSTRSR